MILTLVGITVWAFPAINLFVAVSTIPLQLSLESNTLLLGSTVIVVIPVFANNPLLIVVTLAGMCNDLRPVHPKNTVPSIVVTLLGITRDVNPVQPSNALDPIIFILLGMVTEVRLVQSLNAPHPILVTL